MFRWVYRDSGGGGNNNYNSSNDNDNNNNLLFLLIFSMAQLLMNQYDLLTTLFPPGPHGADLAIYMDTQDVRPNNSHYMNSITHVYSPAWLLIGAVKQTVISQCVRTVNDQCWGQMGCNSLSNAIGHHTTHTVMLMLTLHVSVNKKFLQNGQAQHP